MRLRRLSLPLATMLACAETGNATTLDSLVSVQFVNNAPFAAQLAATEKLHVHTVRLGLYWHVAEPRRGHYDWSSSDARIGQVQRAGLRPILTLFGKSPGYTSADAKVSAPAGGEAQEGFARFAGAAVQRYGIGKAGLPTIYEIWNEPNTRTFWGGLKPDPEAYAAMATAVCKGMKAANPNVHVSALVMEGTPVKTPYRVAAYNLDIYQEWARRAATPELMQCADGFSMHPYLPTPETYLSDEPALRNFVSQHWSKPSPPVIVNSETGYAVDLKRGRLAADQAALDLRVVLVETSAGRVTNLFQAVDTGRLASDPNQNFGLVTASGDLKPAGAALQRLMIAVGNFEIGGVRSIPAMPGTFLFSATRGNRSAKIVWTTGSQAALPVAALHLRNLSVQNLITGEMMPVTGQINLSGSPILILGDS